MIGVREAEMLPDTNHSFQAPVLIFTAPPPFYGIRARGPESRNIYNVSRKACKKIYKACKNFYKACKNFIAYT